METFYFKSTAIFCTKMLKELIYMWGLNICTSHGSNWCHF